MIHSLHLNIANSCTVHGMYYEGQHQLAKSASHMRATTDAGVSRPAAPEHKSLKSRLLAVVNVISAVRLLVAAVKSYHAQSRHEQVTSTELPADGLKGARSTLKKASSSDTRVSDAPKKHVRFADKLTDVRWIPARESTDRKSTDRELPSGRSSSDIRVSAATKKHERFSGEAVTSRRAQSRHEPATSTELPADRRKDVRSNPKKAPSSDIRVSDATKKHERFTAEARTRKLAILENRKLENRKQMEHAFMSGLNKSGWRGHY